MMWVISTEWLAYPLVLALVSALAIVLSMFIWSLLHPGDVVLHLVYRDSHFNKHILTNCPLLRKPLNIPPFFRNTHIQTILPSILPRKPFKFDRQMLYLKDGGSLALDWGKPPNKELDRKAPVLLILPGLTGGPEGFKFLCNMAVRKGYRCVVFNKRGHGGTKLSTPKLQSFGDPSDLRQVVMHIRNLYPDANIVAAGYSAGSGLLGSYLGEYGASSHLTAGVFNCPAYRAEPLFNGGLSRLYEWLLLFFLKQLIKRHKDDLAQVIDVDFAFKSTRLREFEDRLYRTLYRYDNMEQYWANNCPMRGIDNVCIPVLCINSYDDPVCRKSNIPFERFRSRDYFLLAAPEHGGHCGFLHGRKLEPWADKVALEYLSAVLAYQLNPELHE